LELRSFIKETKNGNEVRRAQAVLLIDRETNIEDINVLTELSRSQVFNLRSLFLREGIEALKDKREGKPKEILSKKQRKEIMDILETKKPKDLGFQTDFWNTGILGHWIEGTYKVRYKSRTSYYLMFKEARFTYHKPGRLYHERNEKEVLKWRQTSKKRLTQIWNQEDAVVLSEDEMILTTETTIQKVWLKEGERPFVEVSNGGRKRRSIYGFLNMKNGREHAWKTEYQNMYITKEILEKIRVIYPQQKIVLFWDSAGWHKGSVVQEYLKQDGNIEIIHFPRYAPEENPQEHVWKNGRSLCSHNKFIENIDKATDEFVSYLNITKFQYQMVGFSPKL